MGQSFAIRFQGVILPIKLLGLWPVADERAPGPGPMDLAMQMEGPLDRKSLACCRHEEAAA